MKKGAITFYSILGAVAIVGGYLMYRYFYKNVAIVDEGFDETSGKPKSDKNIDNPQYMALPDLRSFPMKVGDKNKGVWMLQQALNKLGANIEVDGAFGTATYNALCDKYWVVPCFLGYDRKITQEDWQNIRTKSGY